MTEIQMLEKLFAAEVEGRLPFQTRAAMIKRLEAKALVKQMQITLPGRFSVVINGWELTHAGRLLYCTWASKQPDKAI